MKERRKILMSSLYGRIALTRIALDSLANVDEKELENYLIDLGRTMGSKSESEKFILPDISEECFSELTVLVLELQTEAIHIVGRLGTETELPKDRSTMEEILSLFVAVQGVPSGGVLEDYFVKILKVRKAPEIPVEPG